MGFREEWADIVIVCALKEELAAVRAGIGKSSGRLIFRAGMGPESAARCAEEIRRKIAAPRWVISTGICGGLDSRLRIGDVVISAETIDAQSGRRVSSESASGMAAWISDALDHAGIKNFCGKTVCTRETVFSRNDKRALGEKFGAIAVDMESAALFGAFDPALTNCLVMRTVSDTADEDLPPEIVNFLDADGSLRLGKITQFVLKRPTKSIAQLRTLKRNSDQAAAALTAAWKTLA